jgi:dihydrofolate reductase
MLKIIAAVAENRVIGKNGGLPWRLPDDLKRFKQLTGNSPVVMGSKTYWSLPKSVRPLPERENLVLTRHPEVFCGERVTLLSDFQEAVRRSELEDIFVIGGAEVYALALPHAEELFLTRVHAAPEGETLFPEVADEGELVSKEHHSSDTRHPVSFTWEIRRLK